MTEFYLPKSYAWLHYQSLDVSTMAFEANRTDGVPYYEKKYAHAADDDIQESLAELRWIHERRTKPTTREFWAVGVFNRVAASDDTARIVIGQVFADAQAAAASAEARNAPVLERWK